MEKVILTVKEIAEMLSVSQSTVYTMVRENEIPSFRARGKILFNRDVIESWTRGEYREKQAIN